MIFVVLSAVTAITSVAPIALYVNDRSRRDGWTADTFLYFILGIGSI